MKKSSLIMKSLLAVLLAVCIIGVTSCKKKTAEQPSPNTPPASPTTKPAAPPVDANNKATESAPAGMVPLETELPKPVFEGTPVPINVKNLEPPQQGERPPFYVPQGTTNLAAGKPVTASDPAIITGELPMITDGSKEATDGSYVELPPFLQNITIDLGTECNIYAIMLWHYHKQPRVYKDVIVQVASDPDFITNVQTVFNNDDDNTAGQGVGKDKNYVESYQGKLIDAKGVKGRYVRLYSNGNNSDDLNHYIEVEVFGKPAK